MWVPCGIYLERLCLMSGAWHVGNTNEKRPSQGLKKDLYTLITLITWLL